MYMENNLSQKAEEVLHTMEAEPKTDAPKETFVRQSILERPGMVTMPKTPHKSFFKKPIFIVLLLIVLLVVLTSIFSLFNLGRFRQAGEYKKQPMSDAEYQELVKRLEAEGFFNVVELTPAQLEKAQTAYETDTRFQDPPPPTPEERQKTLEKSGTPGVVGANN